MRWMRVMVDITATIQSAGAIVSQRLKSAPRIGAVGFHGAWCNVPTTISQLTDASVEFTKNLQQG